ncbi:aminotransferase class III-fold pyridoxal phosphate-dependent enzyme, partial [bacterium]|nr:aminotransferase class III-fold pyridoxal phosphate-dependent enzyme [bacterium]
MVVSNLTISDEQVKKLDEQYASWGDTVHYSPDPKVFRACEGSYMYDCNDTPYLDLQMMYSACNFGYKNKRITDAVIDQMNTLPQMTPKFIQPYKSLLAEKMSKMIEERFHEKGRM